MAKKPLKHFQAKQRSIEERMEAGKAVRKKLPRGKQGDYKPSKKRVEPVSVLEAQAKTRIPDLIPIRYARMLTSPFAFLRGAAGIMAADLATHGKTTGLPVQACGDMHVANFGIFASADRNLIFGINDFDETLPGPREWDLKRLVASGRFLDAGKGLWKDAVREAVSSYRKSMKHYALMGNMELCYSTIKEDDIMKSLTGTAQEGLS